MKIGLLSDTHSHLEPAIFKHFEHCDELWHGGDIGNLETLAQLQAFKPTKAVYGNIDGQEIRIQCPEKLVFDCGGVKVAMIHIGGYPPRYAKHVKKWLQETQPDLFICGHSHIVKALRDPAINNLLHLNPGAAGKQGFHKVKTMMRFDCKGGKISNLELIELGNRGTIGS